MNSHMRELVGKGAADHEALRRSRLMEVPHKQKRRPNPDHLFVYGVNELKKNEALPYGRLYAAEPHAPSPMTNYLTPDILNLAP